MLAVARDSAIVQPLSVTDLLNSERKSSPESGLKHAQICYLILKR